MYPKTQIRVHIGINMYPKTAILIKTKGDTAIYMSYNNVSAGRINLNQSYYAENSKYNH